MIENDTQSNRSDFIVLPSGEWIRKSRIDTWIDRRDDRMNAGIEVYFNGDHLLFNDEQNWDILVAELTAMAK